MRFYLVSWPGASAPFTTYARSGQGAAEDAARVHDIADGVVVQVAVQRSRSRRSGAKHETVGAFRIERPGNRPLAVWVDSEAE